MILVSKFHAMQIFDGLPKKFKKYQIFYHLINTSKYRFVQKGSIQLQAVKDGTDSGHTSDGPTGTFLP